MKMKKLILLSSVSLLAVTYRTLGQSKKKRIDFNKKRQHTIQIGMLTLGGWAVGNFAISGMSLHASEGNRHYFHQMNLIWNIVNIVLAGVGYYRAIDKQRDLSLTQTIKKQQSLEKILIFNAGLDVAYIVGGLYLLQRAKNEPAKSDQWQGYGQSIMLQGGFLLAFDAVFYSVVHQHAKPLNDYIEKLIITS